MDTHYRYSLIHSVEGTHVVEHAPQEWQEDANFWERSPVYWGMFRSFSTKELTFIKADADFIKLIYDTYGTEAVCTYQVEIYDTATYTYSVLFTGIIDFSTYKYYPLVPSYYSKAKVEIIDDTFTNKIKTRESENINLHKFVDLDGNAITPFTTEEQFITIPSRTDLYRAKCSGSLTDASATPRAFELAYATREDECALNVADRTDTEGEGGAFFKALYDTNALTIYIHITGTITYTGSGQATFSIKRYDEAGTLVSTTAIGTYSTSTGTLTININTSKAITFINEGDYLILLVEYSPLPLTVNLSATDPALSLYTYFQYTKLVYDDKLIRAYPYHEAFTRILQAISGTNTPFYSELFGRTDSENEDYATDGEMSLGCVTNGYLLRGYSFEDENIALNASLKNLFLSLHSIFPMSLGIEEIGGVKKVRIEELRYAFQSAVRMTIENVTNLSEEVASDLTFSSLSLGFEKAEEAYNKIKGRYEYNTKVQYATCITSQKQEFRQVSPYRADTNAIVSCIEKGNNNHESTDTDFDDNVFLLSVVRDDPFQIKRLEGYSTVGGVDNATEPYNLDYQPARNLRRWGSFIKACVNKYASSVLSFVQNDKNSQAYSRQTSESAAIHEGDDIAMSSLANPFFENIYYNFDCVVTNEMIAIMNGYTAAIPNCYWLVGFRNNENEEYKYGWIMKFESRKSDNKGLGSFKLLKMKALN